MMKKISGKFKSGNSKQRNIRKIIQILFDFGKMKWFGENLIENDLMKANWHLRIISFLARQHLLELSHQLNEREMKKRTAINKLM